MNAVRTARLREIAAIERAVVEPAAIDTGTLYVGLENILTGGQLREVRAVSAGELASNKFAFSSRHLLYGKLRPNLAKVARPDFDGICSTDILPVLPGPALDRDYLAHFLLTPRMISWATERAAGANLPRLSPHALADLPIPLPTIESQRRIADGLNRADALRAKRRAALTKLDALTQSFFLDMFGDPGANPKGWTISTISELAEVGTGGTPSRSVAANFGGQIPWVKTTEVNWRVIERSEEHLTELGFRSSRCRLFPRGSVLVALYGQGKTRGKSAILGLDATTNQACGVVLPSPRHDPRFLMHSLKLSYQRLRDLGRGGNQENLNLGILASFAIPLPPLEIQRAFAERIGFVERLARGQHRSLAALDALFASLQHRAFNGDL